LRSLWVSKSGPVTPNGMSVPPSYGTLEAGVPELQPASSALTVGLQSPRAACCAAWMGTVARAGQKEP